MDIQSASPFATALEVTPVISILDYTTDLAHIFVVFVTLHVVAVLAVAGLHLHLDDTPKIPHDVIAEMVYGTIHKHGISPLSPKKTAIWSCQSKPMEEPKLMEYDREQAMEVRSG
jgi:hypothetical protein